MERTKLRPEERRALRLLLTRSRPVMPQEPDDNLCNTVQCRDTIDSAPKYCRGRSHQNPPSESYQLLQQSRVSCAGVMKYLTGGMPVLNLGGLPIPDVRIWPMDVVEGARDLLPVLTIVL